MAILHTHREAITVLDRVRVFVQGDRCVYEQADGGLNQQWNLPFANTACLLLGNGSSITTRAAQLLAQHGVIVGMTSGGGLPIFYGSLSEYRPTEYLQKWIAFWPEAEKRLFAAKAMARLRCECIEESIASGPLHAVLTPLANISTDFESQIDQATSIMSLMGFEGQFAKKLYTAHADIAQVWWNKRDNTAKSKGKDKDRTNIFLDRGNYIAYGAASVVLWCLGIPPSLPVTHGASRAGGLVFDLADIVKDAIVLPRAFHSAAEGIKGQEFRNRLLADFNQMNVISRLFAAIHEILELMNDSGSDLVVDQTGSTVCGEGSGFLPDPSFVVNLDGCHI